MIEVLRMGVTDSFKMQGAPRLGTSSYHLHLLRNISDDSHHTAYLTTGVVQSSFETRSIVRT